MKFLLVSGLLVNLCNAFLTIQLQKLSSFKANEDHVIQLNDYNDNIYVGQLSLGTPEQKFNILFSSLTSDFWVVDSSCTNQECLGYPESSYQKHLYDKTKSSTYSSSNKTFEIRFNSGKCSGEILIDTLTIAGYIISNQTFGSASGVPDIFGYLPYDGVLGFGKSSNSSIVPVIDNLLNQFPQKLITIWLERHLKPDAGSPGGQITLGSLDNTHCDPEINYVPLTSTSFWQFTIDKFEFSSYVTKKSAQAISDTTSPFVGVPSNILSTMIKILHATYDSNYEFYTVPCDSSSSQPKMLFTIGGKELFVESQEYILDYGMNDGKCVVAIFDIANAAIYNVDWLVAEPFHRAYCNVYLFEEDNKIGFTRAIHHEL